MLDGVLQQDSQLLRVVVVVNEAVPPLGDEPGGAGVLRHDGRLAEDQTLGDKGGHGIIAGSADQTGALLHQALDLVTGEPLAVVHVFRVVCGQGADGIHHLLVSGLAHKEEGGLLPYLGRQQADGLAEDIVALAALKGAHRGKQRAAAVVAQIGADKVLCRVIRQAVDERPDLELGPHGAHGVGGVVAHRVDPDILSQLGGDLVGNVGIACKGIVEPPQHRYGGAAQGTDSPGHDHRVDNDEVGTEGHAPGIGDIAAGRPGDDRGPGIQEEMQGATVTGAQHKYLIPHAAQHRHGAYQHDGRAGHIQHMAHNKGTFAVGRKRILGADAALVVEQGLRDESGLSAELRGQRQQLRHIFGVMGGGAAALQQGAADHGAAVLRLQRLALIEGSRPAKAEHSVADGVIRTILQGFGKVHQGGGHQLHVLSGQKHAVHACGQFPIQPVHQPELAVELVSQCGFQGRAAGRCADQQVGALGVAVLLQGQLTLLQGGVIVIHGCSSVPLLSFHGGTGASGCGWEQ